MTTRNLDVILGLLFFTALIALGVVTVVLSDFAFSGQRYDYTMISPDVGYLRPGDPVLVDGMPSGKVQSIERLANAQTVDVGDGETERCTVRIGVRMDVDLAASLYTDADVVIEDRGVLGGRLIRIVEGTSGRPRDPEAPLVALSTPPVVQALGEIVGNSSEDIRATFANFRSMSEDLAEGRGTLGRLIGDDELYGEIEGIASSLGDGAERFADLTASFDGENEGTLGKLINDPALYDTALATFEDIRSFTGNGEGEPGTLGKLIEDPALYDTALEVFTDIQGFTGDLRDGNGTLAKIIEDPALYESVKNAFDDIGVLVEGVSEGKGLLGAALNDPELEAQARRTLERLAEAADDVGGFTAGLGEGEGLLSILVNDEQLAADVQDLIAQALSGLEDARETAPVQGVGGLLFGTF